MCPAFTLTVAVCSKMGERHENSHSGTGCFMQALAQSPDPNNGPELSCTMCEGAYGEDFS
jgi:hypothetical protein